MRLNSSVIKMCSEQGKWCYSAKLWSCCDGDIVAPCWQNVDPSSKKMETAHRQDAFFQDWCKPNLWLHRVRHYTKKNPTKRVGLTRIACSVLRLTSSMLTVAMFVATSAVISFDTCRRALPRGGVSGPIDVGMALYLCWNMWRQQDD